MKRLVLAAVLAAVACTVAFANSATFLRPAPLYTTDQEKFVSAIAGSILNIAAFADRFDEGDPFQVRNILPAGRTSKFTLARRAEVFTIEVEGHVWVPRSYDRLARSFMADGAGLSISEDPARDRTDVAALIDPTPAGLGPQNVRLSRLLLEHPRSASVHERAALLLAAAAKRRAGEGHDVRPLLCRMTAHLAVARALHDGVSADGALAERMLSGLAARESADVRAIDGPLPDGPVTLGARPQAEILPADPAGGSRR